MEVKTRRRVLLDTTPRRLGRWLLLSAVLHAPLTPLAGLVGLISLLQVPDEEAPVLPPVTEIPLDIIEDEAPPPKADAPEPGVPDTTAAPPEPAAPREPDPASLKPQPPKKEEADAGAPDAGEETKDAGAPDAAGDAGTPPENRRPGDGIGDPVAGIGNKRVVDPNANVRLLVHNDRVRRHPLGGQIGPLLRNVYQWRDFFGPTAIDPMRDIDRMLIVGPQLRDSRDVVAILQFNVPDERVRAAVDALVARDPEGGWLDAGVPVAKAHADRNERAFVFPSPQVLVVTPPSAQASAQRLSRKFRLPGPKGDEIAVAHLEAPHRAFIGLPVVIPKSIRSADIRLSPAPDGGVVIDLLAHDETEPLARENAQKLTRALEAATTLDLGLLGSILGGSSKKKFIEKGSFEPDGTDIRGEIVMSRKQVEQVLGYAGAFLGGAAPRPRPAASATPAPSSPVSPSPVSPSPVSPSPVSPSTP